MVDESAFEKGKVFATEQYENIRYVHCDVCGFRYEGNATDCLRIGLAHKLGLHGVVK